MFTNSCIILKNTKSLRDKLEEFGYKIPLCSSYYEGRKRGLLCRPNLAIGVPDDCHDFNLDKYLENNPHIINCCTKENLFLALAALRDDQSYMQWFTDGNDYILCDRQDWIDMYSTLCSGGRYTMDELDKFHKATAQELIQHFKDK